ELAVDPRVRLLGSHVERDDESTAGSQDPLELAHAVFPGGPGNVLHHAQAEDPVEAPLRKIEPVGRTGMKAHGVPAVLPGKPPERMDAGGAKDDPLGERADVPVEALLPIEDEARPLIERRVGHVALVTADREVEGEGAATATHVEGGERPRA